MTGSSGDVLAADLRAEDPLLSHPLYDPYGEGCARSCRGAGDPLDAGAHAGKWS